MVGGRSIFVTLAVCAFGASSESRPLVRLSRQERLALLLKAVDGCAGQCPACALWALEWDEAGDASAAAPTQRRSPC